MAISDAHRQGHLSSFSDLFHLLSQHSAVTSACLTSSHPLQCVIISSCEFHHSKEKLTLQVKCNQMELFAYR